jgi:hypothetical protein
MLENTEGAPCLLPLRYSLTFISSVSSVPYVASFCLEFRRGKKKDNPEKLAIYSTQDTGQINFSEVGLFLSKYAMLICRVMSF